VKLKQVPEDFVVEEGARIRPGRDGRWTLYLLHKRGIGTLEALRAVRRAWRIPPRAVGFGGLKDRHALTRQWVTIAGGPARDLDARDFRLSFEGRSRVPMTRMALLGNRFRIRIRDLAREEARTARRRFEELTASGLPAYFDEQRFGSLRGGGGFAALHLLRGDPESALRAVIASPAPEDRAAVRERKRRIRDGWGRWEEALPHLNGSILEPPVRRLASHPGDFVGAFLAVEREERRLLASAYASAVWNRAVATRLSAALPPAERLVIEGPAGNLVLSRSPALLAPFRDAVLPLPAPGARAEDPEWQRAIEAALAEDGLSLDRMVLPESLSMAFRPTRRRVLFRPTECSAHGPVADDLNRGRMALDLDFRLDPGLYATLILKVLTEGVAGRPSHRRRRGSRAG
jgi:tRNA pseudouridine13 synthase